jgi:hypothetical protein
MLKRLLLGLVIGLVVGGLAAGVAIEGLGLVMFAGGGGAALAYVFAAFTGVLVGLVAGKPIWAKGGQIEAGLKAFFGALLGAGLMFAIRSWLNVSLDLSQFHAGVGTIGYLPAAALPLIAMILGGFYELDNTGDDTSDKGSTKKDDKKLASGKGNGTSKSVRVAADEEGADEAEEQPAAKKRR